MDPIERLAPYSQTVFQDPLLFSHLSIGANIALSLNRYDQARRTARIIALLEQLGLAGMIAGDPFQLSRGQMMRVSVARALAPHPKVILLDEPFSALDAVTRQQVQSALFDQIKADGGYGILVTHHGEDRPPDGECVCLTPFFVRRLKSPLAFAVKPLDAAGIKATQVTLIGAVIGLAAATLIAADTLLLGGLLFLMNRLFDASMVH